ncbi:MAG: GIY-YIG nuclease family protein [Patescibacteria group bacterium]
MKTGVVLTNSHENLLNVNPTTGIYIYSSGNTPIYIGKAVNLKARLLSHEQNAKYDAKEEQIVNGADTIELIYTPSEFAALLLEAKLISQHKPKFNVRWRDDKSNLYIKITMKEEYPKVLLARKEDDGKSMYFGPFSSTYSAESLLRSLRRIIPFCTQRKLSNRSCFYHKLGLCNPCPNEINKIKEIITKNQERNKYKKNIRSLINVLTGKSDKVVNQLKREIKDLTKKQDYEMAIKYRDTLKRLEFLMLYGRIESEMGDVEDKSEDSQKALISILKTFFPNLDKLERIETYDNSTLGFEHSVASMVVFENGRSNNQEYRRFKLNPKTSISDFDMMREVMERRLDNHQWKKPDLIVVDGGKPQVRVVMKVFEKLKIDIPLIGIAKHPDRLIIGLDDLPTVRPSAQNLGFRLVQYGRDEAHRFAKKYHVHLRNKASVLQ